MGPAHHRRLRPGRAGRDGLLHHYRQLPGRGRGQRPRGTYAYVAGGDLFVVDVSDPAAPVEAAVYNTPGWATNVTVASGASGTYAYVADLDGGVRILNVSDPEAPAEVGFYRTPGGAVDVAVAGGYAYVADSYGGLAILRFPLPRVYLPLVARGN